MGTVTLVPVEEYLHTSFDPDCDYIEGRIVERNVGERDHSLLQIALGSYLFTRRKEFGISVFTEQRIRVAPDRYRIPDLCVVVGPKPAEKVFTQPPFIVFEILSEEDRLSRIQERIDDYLAMGIPYVWVIDPTTHFAWRYTTKANIPIRDGILRTETPEITIDLEEIFQSME